MQSVFIREFSSVVRFLESSLELFFELHFDEYFVYRLKISPTRPKIKQTKESKGMRSPQNAVFSNAKSEILNYLNAKSKTLNIHYKINENLSDFAKSVFLNLAQIPYGEIISYKNLAGLSKSNATRALGNMMAKNELMLILPCHRVVPSTFKILKSPESKRAKSQTFKNIGNFCSSSEKSMVDIKRFLLELEFENRFSL